MAWVPKSFTPAPRSKPPGRSRVYKEFKSEGDTKPPRKPRKTKIVDSADEEAVRQASQSAAARQYKARRAEVFSKASDASDKQRGYLRILLGGFENCHTSELIRFVEFANQLPSGVGSMSKYDKNMVWLSSIYWVRAIDMALKGSNDLTSAIDEVAISFGYKSAWDMETGGLNLPTLPSALPR